MLPSYFLIFLLSPFFAKNQGGLENGLPVFQRTRKRKEKKDCFLLNICSKSFVTNSNAS